MKSFDQISESQVEDALVGNLDSLAKYLNLGGDKPLKLIARQLPLDSGKRRIDLLLAFGGRLILAELKAEPFVNRHLEQVTDYRVRLQDMQKAEKLTAGEIDAYLLVTAATPMQINAAKACGVRTIVYSPLEVMRDYFQRLAMLSSFLRIKPKDYGTYSIGRTLRVLEKMASGETRKESIARSLALGKDTVDHLLRGAEDFGLARRKKDNWFLTDFGDVFTAAGENDSAQNRLSARQVDMMKEFISRKPFYSPSIFGVYALVECAFLLSRNRYPIDIRDLKDNFRMVSGKMSEWRDNVVDRRTRAFLRFAVELELLGRIGDQAVITPAGFRFILMLQLHKGIEMVDGLSFQSNT